jgi:hypothetical protein
VAAIAGSAVAMTAGRQDVSPVSYGWPAGPLIEEFLKEARVVERTSVGTGITNPEKVTLELHGVVRFAIFKQVEQQTDSWQFEVAAYELAKLFEIGNVPATVARTLRGRRGCLQLWIEGVTLAKLTSPPADLERWREQVSTLWLFDDLIANIDCHLNNAIVTPNFNLAFIDNSKSFRPERRLLNNLDSGAGGTQARYWMVPIEQKPVRYPVRYPERLIENLRSVRDDEIRKAVGRYMDRGNVRLLLERRKMILKRIDEMKNEGA